MCAYVCMCVPPTQLCRFGRAGLVFPSCFNVTERIARLVGDSLNLLMIGKKDRKLTNYTVDWH